METVEIVAKVIGLILSCAALITLVVKVVSKYKEIENYKKDIAALKNDMADLRTNTTAQFQTIMAELTIQTRSTNAILDGLQQLGCNHTVPKAKEELEEYLNIEAHKVKEL